MRRPLVRRGRMRVVASASWGGNTQRGAQAVRAARGDFCVLPSWRARWLIHADVVHEHRRRKDCVGLRIAVEVAADREIQDRSEEHTSELQSQSNIVCRL